MLSIDALLMVVLLELLLVCWRVLRQAVHRIGAYTMERALLGELPHQVALTALSALEGKEAAVDGVVSITMDDAAAKWAE